MYDIAFRNYWMTRSLTWTPFARFNIKIIGQGFKHGKSNLHNGFPIGSETKRTLHPSTKKPLVMKNLIIGWDVLNAGDIPTLSCHRSCSLLLAKQTDDTQDVYQDICPMAYFASDGKCSLSAIKPLICWSSLSCSLPSRLGLIANCLKANIERDNDSATWYDIQ